MSRSILSPLLALSFVLLLSPAARAEDVPVPPVTPVAGAPVASETTPTALTPGRLAGVDVMTATVFQQGQSSFSGLGLRFRINDSRLLEQVRQAEPAGQRPTGDDGQHGEHHQRGHHDPGRLVCVIGDVMIPRRTGERHEPEAEHVERVRKAPPATA